MKIVRLLMKNAKLKKDNGTRKEHPMISKKFTAKELIGLKCRPVRDIHNGNGDGITPDTLCTITSAHYGINIKTEKCPCCGQYCCISRISREDLVLESDVVRYKNLLIEELHKKGAEHIDFLRVCPEFVVNCLSNHKSPTEAAETILYEREIGFEKEKT